MRRHPDIPLLGRQEYIPLQPALALASLHNIRQLPAYTRHRLERPNRLSSPSKAHEIPYLPGRPPGAFLAGRFTRHVLLWASRREWAALALPLVWLGVEIAPHDARRRSLRLADKPRTLAG
jgi:hypothetical protein